MLDLLAGGSRARASSTNVQVLEKSQPLTRLPLALCPLTGLGFPEPHPKGDSMPNFHDLEAQSITGEPTRLSQFEGQLCLVVNVASA
jgi:hypothetical protein